MSGLRLFTPLSLALAIGSGCISYGQIKDAWECDPPTSAEIHFEAGAEVNKNDAGKSTTTEVRVLQLTTLNEFEKKLPQEVFADTAAALGDTLLGEEITYVHVSSMTEKPMKLLLEDKARFLVFVGIFKKAKSNVWWASYELPTTEKEYCEVGTTIHMRYELEHYQISGGVVRKGD